MKALHIRSWEKARTIYRWTLILTVIVMAFIMPRIVAPDKMPFHNYALWVSILLFPLTYLVFILIPVIAGVVIEALLFVVNRRYSLDDAVTIGYVFWVLLALCIVGEAVYVIAFKHVIHLPVNLLPFH